jgi:hypothetical protein
MKVTMDQLTDYLSKREVRKHKATKKDIELILRDLGYLMALESEYGNHSRIYKMLVRQGKKTLKEN